MIDPKYFPISLDSTPKLSKIPSMNSMIDDLYKTAIQISDTETGSTSKTQVTYDPLDTALYDEDADVASDAGHISGQVPKYTADGSHDTFLATGSAISSTPYLNEGREELCSTMNDAQDDGVELALSVGNSPVVSDAYAVSRTSTNYIVSGDTTGNVTSMSLKQSSDYIINENQPAGSHRLLYTFDLDGHVSESELPPSVGLETAFDDQQPLSLSNQGTENQEYFQTNELQPRPGYIPNTHLLSSVEGKLDSFGCKSPEGSVSPSVNGGGGLGTAMMSLPKLSSPSPHHCRTPSDSSLDYFNSIMHGQLNASSLPKMQRLSASSGYIIDCSGSSARENGGTLP